MHELNQRFLIFKSGTQEITIRVLYSDSQIFLASWFPDSF